MVAVELGFNSAYSRVWAVFDACACAATRCVQGRVPARFVLLLASSACSSAAAIASN